MPNPHQNLTGQPLPANAADHASLGSSFAGRHGFALKLTKNEMLVFIHDDLAHADRAKRAHILKQGGPVAHVRLNPAGYKWAVHAEPTEEGRVGLSVLTEKGKTIAAGEAWLEADGSIKSTCQTLYPGITNAIKLDASIKATLDASGNPTVTASVGASC